MKTEEIVRSLRWCGTGTEENCGGCAFEPQCDEDAVGCVGGLCDAAADKIEELVDRCARYAEEIAALRERMRPYEDTGLTKVYADLQAAVAEAVAAMTEQRGRGYASDKESWADLAKRVEECDDLLKNIKKVQKDMWKAIRENDPDSYGALSAELLREALAMTMNWLGVTAASKVALEMTEE